METWDVAELSHRMIATEYRVDSGNEQTETEGGRRAVAARRHKRLQCLLAIIECTIVVMLDRWA